MPQPIIYIGTGGYSDTDLIGTLYPRHAQSRLSAPLRLPQQVQIGLKHSAEKIKYWIFTSFSPVCLSAKSLKTPRVR